jgi:hypothetical protein
MKRGPDRNTRAAWRAIRLPLRTLSGQPAPPPDSEFHRALRQEKAPPKRGQTRIFRRFGLAADFLAMLGLETTRHFLE